MNVAFIIFVNILLIFILLRSVYIEGLVTVNAESCSSLSQTTTCPNPNAICVLMEQSLEWVSLCVIACDGVCDFASSHFLFLYGVES